MTTTMTRRTIFSRDGAAALATLASVAKAAPDELPRDLGAAFAQCWKGLVRATSSPPFGTAEASSSRRLPQPLTAALLSIALGYIAFGGGARDAVDCALSERRAGWVQLFFGRDVGGRSTVDTDSFQRFVALEVTPRFPEGMTIIDALGQWRAPDGRIVREPSTILMLAAPLDQTTRRKVAEIRTAYMRAFAQDSVLLVTQPACLRF